MRLGTRIFDDARTRMFCAGAAVLAAFSVALAPLHTASALLSLPFTGTVAYVVCDLLSYAVTGRAFVFPSKWGLNTSEELGLIAWTDHVLALLFAMLMILGLFVFGELVDCVRHENVWRGEVVGLDWCIN
jgi:hypothetical protein